MQLNEQAINELEKIWVSIHPGQHISRAELNEVGCRLLRITKIATKVVDSVQSPE